MPRQEAKALNRQRITRAADDIIRSEGLEKLTMRRLADVAGVALKTPYNLFGSKTNVLISLLDAATSSLLADLDDAREGSALVGLTESLEQIRTFFASDETYYQSIYWEIMTSDQPEARAVAHNQIIELIITRISHAKDKGEIKKDIRPTVLGRQLGLQFLALLGSWAAGHVSIDETIDQTQAIWAALFAGAATPKYKPEIATLRDTAQRSIE